MPFVRLETSVALSAAQRQDLMHAVIACAAEHLAVPAQACRAAYDPIDRADRVIGTGTNEPWAIAYAHMKAGRTPAIKAAFTNALFDLLAAQLGVPRNALRILITDYAPEDWNNGGNAESTLR
jgi:phenylpyruvate tautomerase PptA (4-oxalocrotonate tautomerase family)